MKNKKGGVVWGVVGGAGLIIIAAIVVLVVVSTLWDGDLLRTGKTTTTVEEEVGWLNSTGYQVKAWDVEGLNKSLVIVTITNGTDDTIRNSGNYTFSSETGYIYNTTTAIANADSIKINYTYSGPTNYELTQNYAGRNLSRGFGSVGEKLPTVLLLAAIVILFGVIVLLVKMARSTGYMGDSSL